MTIKYHYDLEQGSDDWLSLRCGCLTASEMKNIITPKTLQPVNKGEISSHHYELLSQRITGYVEPQYISDDMLRGMGDEIEARTVYSKTYAEVKQVGFITNDKWGFTIGYSPDGLVGDDGLIEVKSRRQKFQVESILDDEMPDDYRIQVQTGLLVSERKWVDFITYCGGMPMMTKRIFPDDKVQESIVSAAQIFQGKLDVMMKQYQERLAVQGARLVPTERKIEEEMI